MNNVVSILIQALEEGLFLSRGYVDVRLIRLGSQYACDTYVGSERVADWRMYRYAGKSPAEAHEAVTRMALTRYAPCWETPGGIWPKRVRKAPVVKAPVVKAPVDFKLDLSNL